MSFQAMAWAITQKLPTREKFVLLMLANYASNERGDCYPSLNRLGEDTGMSRNTVIEAIKAMEALGILTIQRRSQDGVNLPNVYRLNFEWSGRMGSVADALRGGGPPDALPVHLAVGGSSPDEPKPVIQPINKKKESAGARTKVEFDREAGAFTNIPDEQIAMWTRAYPGVNVQTELVRAACWMLANSTEGRTLHLKFLNGWMSRQGNRPVPMPTAAREPTRLERNAAAARELIGNAGTKPFTGGSHVVIDVDAIEAH